MGFDPVAYALGANGAPVRGDLVSWLMGKAAGGSGEHTESGSVVTFDGNGKALKKLIAAIVSVQSGSGDPSPTNVRPITGWDGVTVYVSPTQDVQDATTYSVSFGSAGSVYGGMVDVTKGVLTVDRVCYTLDGTEGFTMSTNYFNRSLSNLGWEPIDTNTLTEVLSSHFLYHAANVPTTGAGNAWGYFRISAQGAVIIGNVEGGNKHYTSAAEFNSFLADAYAAGTPVQILYKLATPVEAALTPTEILTLVGVNNVWADTGDVTVTIKG